MPHPQTVELYRQVIATARDNLHRAQTQQSAAPLWRSGNGEPIGNIVADYERRVEELTLAAKAEGIDSEQLRAPSFPDAPTRPLVSPVPLFLAGAIVLTQGAIAALTRNQVEPMTLVERHVRGDWGKVDADDAAVNARAVRGGRRIISAYDLSDGTTVLIVTEADRSATTLLLPDEY